MKIGIIAAMDKELSLLKKALDDMETTTLDKSELHIGKIGVNTVMCIKCGIGKVNSALRTYEFIKAERPDVIINSGVAGSGDESMNIGDLLWATEVAYHDAWCGPGTVYGAADGFPQRLKTDSYLTDMVKKTGLNLNYGLICSGDKFMTTAEELSEVKEKFPDCLAVDMESTSIGQVCNRLSVPFAILRAVSDRPGNGDNISEYKNFWEDTPVHLANTLKTIIKNI